MQDQLVKLEKILNLKFKNIDTLKKAITHKSYDSNNNYEQLEFLGDRILGFVISKKIIQLFFLKLQTLIFYHLKILIFRNYLMDQNFYAL